MFKWLSNFLNPDYQSQGMNPFDGRIGQAVDIDDLDYGLNWVITNIHQYESSLGKYIDYDVKAFTYAKEERGKIRVIKNKVLFLLEYDQLAYDEGLYDVLQNPQDPMNVDDEEIGLHEEYRRPRTSSREFCVSVLTLTDTNGDGKVSGGETTKSSLRLWDYERTTVIDGVTEKQYLFVELSTDSTFTLYRGKELIRSKVKFY